MLYATILASDVSHTLGWAHTYIIILKNALIAVLTRSEKDLVLNEIIKTVLVSNALVLNLKHDPGQNEKHITLSGVLFK